MAQTIDCPACGADLTIQQDELITCGYCHRRYRVDRSGETPRLSIAGLPKHDSASVAIAEAAGIRQGAAVYPLPVTQTAQRATRNPFSPPGKYIPPTRQERIIAGIVIAVTICLVTYCVLALSVADWLTPW